MSGLTVNQISTAPEGHITALREVAGGFGEGRDDQRADDDREQHVEQPFTVQDAASSWFSAASTPMTRMASPRAIQRPDVAAASIAERTSVTALAKAAAITRMVTATRTQMTHGHAESDSPTRRTTVRTNRR